MDIRKGHDGDGAIPYTKCPQCSPKMPGILWLRRDHESRGAVVCGCGCGNTRPGSQTLKELLEENENLSLGHFENADGKRCHESEVDFRARSRQECIEALARLEKGKFTMGNWGRAVSAAVPDAPF